jgi:hypothetical protein
MKNKSKIWIMAGLLTVMSCKDLSELNVNPNGLEPTEVNPNLVMPYVLSEYPKSINKLSFEITAGIMQQIQLDGWFGDANGYYFGRRDWKPYYDLLTNNKLVYDRAEELGFEFHQGVALVMRGMMFGLVTDLWGDAPYTTALQGQGGSADEIQPAYDSQESIYAGVIADLETANTILSKEKSAYIGMDDKADIWFAGDPTRWRKLANSLMLRFYMRISAKKPDVAKAGIEKIMADATKYPIISTAADDALMDWPGSTSGTSFPTAVAYDISESGYSRIKMDSLFVARLLELEDPRIGVFAEKVEIPLLVNNAAPEGTDHIITVSGKKYRELSPDVVEGININTNTDYVGLPTQLMAPGSYNLNPNSSTQGAANPHVSQISRMYREKNGDLIKARIMTAAEVHFILAEAAVKGWNVGTAESHYNDAVKASFDSWAIGGEYGDYISGDAAFDGSNALEQIIEQKWIASWGAATEAWFDYRRTGLPDLQTYDYAFKPVIPVRFPYGDNEVGLNAANANAASSKLKTTRYTQQDGANSGWSKPWLIQGTGKPWAD